jgi:hypothetical protein
MIEFLEPWFPIDPDEKISLNNESKKEVPPNHILFLIVGTEKVADVHLTRTHKQESGIYPTTHFFSIQDFIKEMKLENEAR